MRGLGRRACVMPSPRQNNQEGEVRSLAQLPAPPLDWKFHEGRHSIYSAHKHAQQVLLE